MNPKVEALIENVAAYLYKAFGNWKESSYYDLSELNKESWKEYARDILSQNDLALIDRERKLPETKLDGIWVAWAEIQKNKMLDAGYLPVIPLKEMKE